jgi:hypothetical protein
MHYIFPFILYVKNNDIFIIICVLKNRYFPKVLFCLGVLFLIAELLLPILEIIYKRGLFLPYDPDSPTSYASVSETMGIFTIFMTPSTCLLLNKVISIGRMQFLPLLLTSTVCAGTLFIYNDIFSAFTLPLIYILVILCISWVQSYYLVWEYFTCQLDKDTTPRCRGGYLSDAEFIDADGNIDVSDGEGLRSIGEGEEFSIIRRQYGNLFSASDMMRSSNSNWDSGSESGSEEGGDAALGDSSTSDDFDYLADIANDSYSTTSSSSYSHSNSGSIMTKEETIMRDQDHTSAYTQAILRRNNAIATMKQTIQNSLVYRSIDSVFGSIKEKVMRIASADIMSSSSKEKKSPSKKVRFARGT